MGEKALKNSEKSAWRFLICLRQANAEKEFLE